VESGWPFLPLLIWIITRLFLMGAFSFLLHYIDKGALQTDIFQIHSFLAVGFLAYAAVAAFPIAIRNTITWMVMLFCTVATFLLFRSPWIFPALIVLSGAVTNLSKKRIPQKETVPRKIKWGNIWLWAFLFLCWLER
jgi:chromate transporter